MHTSGRCIPKVILTHDDDDTNSHVRHHVSASRECKCFVKQFYIGNVLTSWSDPMQNGHSLQPIPNQTSANPWELQYSVTYPQKCACSSWTSWSGSVGHTTSTRSFERSARNGSTCSALSTRKISCCYSSIWSRLRGKTLPILLARNCEAHIYNVQMQGRQLEHEPNARFSQRQGELLSRFSQEANQTLENLRANLANKYTLMYRNESSCTTFGRRFATTKSGICWTTAALDRIGSGNSAILRDVWSLELFNQPLDQKLIDFDKEKQNFYEKYDVTSMTEQNLMLYRTNQESHESRTPEGLQLISEVRREVMQLKALAVPPNFSRNLEAKIESHKTEIQSVQWDPHSTQDSLNSWDAVNLNSIQGVCVGESVATSTSSVSRLTEQAISYPPQSRGDPDLFHLREHFKAKQRLQLLVRHQRVSRQLQWQYTILPCRRLLYQLAVQKLQWESLIMEDSKRVVQSQLLLNNGHNQQSWEVGKLVSRAECLILHNVPEPLCNGLVKLRMLKVLTISLLQHLGVETRFRTSENLDFKIASGLRKIFTWNFKKQVTTAEGRAQSEKRSLTGRQIAWMIHDVYTHRGDTDALLDFRDLSKVHFKNDNVQAFGTKWDEVPPTDNIWERMQAGKSGGLKYLLQNYAQETTLGTIEVDGPKTSWA